MMRTFLERVARDLAVRWADWKYDVAVVFPNKRAALFFEHALLEQEGKTMWTPMAFAIDELFHTLAPLKKAEELKLIGKLYHVYIKHTQRHETFDEFYPRGRVMLADFEDIDKHLADAKDVFTNIANIHQLDNLDYLTETQKESIKRFFNSFSDKQNSRLKENFLQLWNRLYDIYHDFIKELKANGIGYTGLLMRETVSEEHNNRLKAQLNLLPKHFLFVGFNFLQPAESELLTRIKQHTDTRFYWDYDHYYLNDWHEAGSNIRENIARFGNALMDDDDIYNGFAQQKNIQLVSAVSENHIARFSTQWLNTFKKEDIAITPPNTAIVLCNERLLPTVIHAIPEHISDVNITVGYPLGDTAVASLLNRLVLFYQHGVAKDGKYLRVNYVRQLLAHPYITSAFPDCHTLQRTLRKTHTAFIHKQRLCTDEHMTQLFDTVSPNEKNHSTTQTRLSQWLTKNFRNIARILRSAHSDDIFMQEALYQAFTQLQQLNNLIDSEHIELSILTYQQLLRQVIRNTTIPFHGEPAIGLQIMGMLETRNLDFDNLLLLSCSEQYMPQKHTASSLIPYAIRKAHNLTTTERREAIQSYYFYRLLQRAKNITIAHANTEAGPAAGQLSRFVLQLMTESPHDIAHIQLHSNINVHAFAPQPIIKSSQVMQKLMQKNTVSPTAINHYLGCGRHFVFQHLCDIGQKDLLEEDGIDSRLFGSLFHRTVEHIYKPFAENGETITTEHIHALLSSPHAISRIIDNVLTQTLYDNGTTHPTTHNTLSGTQHILRNVLITYVRNMLSVDMECTPFCIIALEKKFTMPLNINDTQRTRQIELEGIIDRIDLVTNKNNCQQLRIIDYKTGKKPNYTIGDITEIFDHSEKADIRGQYLQTMLYSIMVRHALNNKKFNLPQPLKASDVNIAPAIIYIRAYNKQEKQQNDQTPNIQDDQTQQPILCINKQPINDITPFATSFLEQLQQVFADMMNTDKPLHITADNRKCEKCDYKLLCQFSNFPNE